MFGRIIKLIARIREMKGRKNKLTFNKDSVYIEK